jgi:hypothetical protein
VGEAEWNRLGGDDDPFIEHAFLAALETSGSVGRRAGNLPRFVLVRDGAGRLIGAVPLYLKNNSYGEFIFDWAWASAAHRAGISYYPKLVAAIPFTPATGQRLLIAPEADPVQVTEQLIEGIRATADAERASSIHVLFCTEAETEALSRHGLRPRLSLQFHWHNRPDQPYRDFEDYLGSFKSRHRKQVRRERQIAASHGLTFKTLTGTEMGDVDWQALRDFYSANASKHGGIEYLTPAFFDVIRATYAHRVVSTLAYRDDVPVAGTFNFEKGRHIYGRYWGCVAEYPMLHFELCYHRLIERAIARGCTRFEAGAQGEHKLKRGLMPAFTHSNHWLRHPGLAASVSEFLVAEAEAVREQAAALATESPFRAGGEPDPGAGEADG